MLQIPRQVPIVLLASGSRVEVLTRCKASAGTTYILSATNNPDPFNPNNVASFANDANRVVQQSVATITITVSICRLATKLEHCLGCHSGWSYCAWWAQGLEYADKNVPLWTHHAANCSLVGSLWRPDKEQLACVDWLYSS